MREMHLPWLEMSVLLPLLAAPFIFQMRNANHARTWSVVVTVLTFFSTVGAWLDFYYMHVMQADDRWHLMSRLLGKEIFVIDQLSAPLLPMAALLYSLTTITTLRTKIRRFSFAWMLISESILLATFSCKEPQLVIALLAIGTVPPYVELLARNKPTRVYFLHMLLFVVLMLVGWYFAEHETGIPVHSLWAILPLLGAILVRSGIFPFHCWMTDLFERATFGTALLYAVPLSGAYATMRLVLPIAPDWVLRSIVILSLFTAVYTAGMALVQKEARRFFCYILLSHSALVLVGLETATPIALTGGLCVWLSIGMALGGFGLTIRALESRRGRLSLADYQGLYEHTPNLAMLFILTGLASVGFPGTVGFIGAELLVDGAVHAYPYIGVAVVLAAALNGIAMVQAYFLLFTGKRYASTVSLMIGRRERFAVLALAALMMIGGLIPQPGVKSRFGAAEEILGERLKNHLTEDNGSQRHEHVLLPRTDSEVESSTRTQ